MKIKITANDTLHFGSGKSTNAGESSFGAAMFPPYPTVFLGALRSAYLSQNPEYITTANQPGDPTLEYKLTFFAMLIDGVPHFPAPADTYVVGDSPKLSLLSLKENDGLSSHKLPYYLWTDHDGKVLTPEGRYVCADVLGEYLTGEGGARPSVKLSDYTEREIRVGIARDNYSRAAADSMLYNSAMTRPWGCEFAVELDGGKLPTSSGLIRLGKHGKTAAYWTCDFGTTLPWSIGENGVFKLCFATPAIFDCGSIPTLPDGLPEVELIASAVSGYENVGGYDMRENRPKPMERAVKAGSVFYYRLADNTEENRAAVAEKLHGKCISPKYEQAGFGLCYVGKAELKGEN
jgi:CRISPR-associated protein Cmr3